jgi:membrane protease YdiL (CAAX protease family)
VSPLLLVSSDGGVLPANVGDLGDAAFQRGAWRGWGLAVVFISGLLALAAGDALTVWAVAAATHGEARSLAGFVALYIRARHDPAVLASFAGPVQIAIIVTARSAAAVGAVYGLRGMLPADSMRALGFSPPTARQLGFAAFAVLAALSVGIVVNVVWIHFVGQHQEPWTRILASHRGPLAYLLDISQASIASPIAEETLFRGLLFAGLAQRMPPVAAAALSSTIFGLIHLDLWGLPSLITSGLVFAWVYYRTRNLWASIVTHGLVNWVAFSLYYLAQSIHPR